MNQTFECETCREGVRSCPRCYSRIRNMLSQFPEQHTLLTLSRQPVKTGGDGRSSKALHAPLPGRVDTLNMLGPAARQNVTDGRDQVGPVPFLAVLESWVEVVEDERRLTRCRRHVTPMTERLLTHLRWVVEQPWAGDFEEEIRELLTTVQRITMTLPVRELLRGVRCPSCDMTTLFRHHPGDWAAECSYCPSVRLDQRDFDLLVKAQVTEQTAADAVNT